MVDDSSSIFKEIDCDVVRIWRFTIVYEYKMGTQFYFLNIFPIDSSPNVPLLIFSIDNVEFKNIILAPIELHYNFPPI